ncbi:MAG: RnfH family protein [Burkholderiaceae bacterium]
MKITLLYSPQPREVIELTIALDEGLSAQDALTHSGWLQRFPEVAGGDVQMSVWGRKAKGDVTLRDGDRLEFCRALRVDPKVARRERFVGQGARGTGLFAQRRPGSKAGY